MLDPITALAFSVFENKGVYAVLLGSGLSRAARVPTGWEITLDLVRRAVERQAERRRRLVELGPPFAFCAPLFSGV
jgi:hypothetical protein